MEELISKVSLIVFLLGVIYLWNRFVVKNIIKFVIGFHKRYNSNNVDKQPVKFMVTNEEKIYKIASGFYWFGGVAIVIGILFGG